MIYFSDWKQTAPACFSHSVLFPFQEKNLPKAVYFWAGAAVTLKKGRSPQTLKYLRNLKAI